jgi:hypothetical protein
MPYVRDKTKYTNPVKAIRAFCRECMCGVTTEIANCTAPECPLYAFRFGKNPYRTKRLMTEAQRSAAAARLARAREAANENA